MRFDVPLMPVSVELRQRDLPPLRFSIRRLLALVVVVAVGCGLIAEFRRHARAIASHHQQGFSAQPNGPWHAAQSALHQAALHRIELLLLIYVAAVGPITLAFLAGRLMGWVHRRRDASRDG